MKVVAVACHQCGASLELEESMRFVTCRNCGTDLEVRKKESILWTEVQSEMEDSEKGPKPGSDVTDLEGQLERLEMEWGVIQRQYSWNSEHDATEVPTRKKGVGLMIVGIVVMPLSILAVFVIPLPIICAPLGIVAGCFLFAFGRRTIALADDLLADQVIYQTTRKELETRLAKARRQSAAR